MSIRCGLWRCAVPRCFGNPHSRQHDIHIQHDFTQVYKLSAAPSFLHLIDSLGSLMSIYIYIYTYIYIYACLCPTPEHLHYFNDMLIVSVDIVKALQLSIIAQCRCRRAYKLNIYIYTKCDWALYIWLTSCIYHHDEFVDESWLSRMSENRQMHLSPHHNTHDAHTYIHILIFVIMHLCTFAVCRCKLDIPNAG